MRQEKIRTGDCRLFFKPRDVCRRWKQLIEKILNCDETDQVETSRLGLGEDRLDGGRLFEADCVGI